jgi:hypothetical protein
MVCGLDLHRDQFTFDALDTSTGEVWRGRLFHPYRERFRRWLAEDLGPRAHGEPVAVAVEGCTGWRYVVEELTAAGFEAHVAEPAEAQAQRGPKHRAKTDRSDARLLRQLLADNKLPESWIPPEPVLEWRERIRLYKALVDQRTQWVQRTHAELFHHGLPASENDIRSPKTEAALTSPALRVTPAARERIAAAYQKLRWALYEAAKCSSRRTSPDHAYYAAAKGRMDGKLATISVARKLALRCYHTLRAMDPTEVYAIP